MSPCLTLRVDYSPERYKLSVGLSTLLGVDLETRPRIISALFQYVNLHDLLTAADATVVAMDDRLKAGSYTRPLLGSTGAILVNEPFCVQFEPIWSVSRFVSNV